jgi:hypothetical protein
MNLDDFRKGELRIHLLLRADVESPGTGLAPTRLQDSGNHCRSEDPGGGVERRL